MMESISSYSKMAILGISRPPFWAYYVTPMSPFIEAVMPNLFLQLFQKISKVFI